MAESEQAIPETVMDEARLLARRSVEIHKAHGWVAEAAEPIALALLAAKLRGREAQKEADARIAEDEDGHFSVWGEDRNTTVAQQTCRDIATTIRNS